MITNSGEAAEDHADDRRRGGGREGRGRFIYTDVWVSMGEAKEVGGRIALLRGYQVNAQMMALTGNPN